MKTAAFLAIGSLSFTLAASALPASAATGLAWDEVTKFSMDSSVPAPNFGPDFQTASQPPQAQKQHGGMFGGIQNAMGAAAGAMQMMKNGIAQRHYVVGNFRRTDDVAQQTATILDCRARTITYLDLAKKTYRVVSLDQPPQTSRPGPRASQAPQSAQQPQDDGTRYKIAYNSQALGPKQIEGVNTDGYKAAMQVTATKPNGESRTFNTNLTEYLSGYAQPQQSCPSSYVESSAAAGAGSMGAGMNMTRMINAAMLTAGGDPRFTFTSTGPRLPSGRLDLFSVWQFSGENSQGRGFITLIERGNVRQINDTDTSIFGVPSDFTKTT